MSDKRKKTLTPEQLEKMRIGRAKAFEKRKLEREKEKAIQKAEQEAIKKQKLKDIELQKQALQQQKDRIESLKISKKKKAEIKKRLKEVKDKPEVLQEVEAIVETYEGKLSPITEDHKEQENTAVFENLKLTVDDTEDTQQSMEEEYKEIFETESKKIAKSLPSNARKLFLEQVTYFDVQKDVSENINLMIKNLLNRVETNKKVAESVQQAIEKVETLDEKVVVNDTIKKPKKNKLNNNLQLLYNLR